ncbi:MAG: MFS transporter, partial [Yoonia sp.]
LILSPLLVVRWEWNLGLLIIGFCFCGVYVSAESWLNDASSNETRGKALSLYLMVQMAGIVLAQFIVAQGDVSGYALFIIPSVLVSLAFAPILLSIRPMPQFEQTKPMTIRRLIEASPLGCVGMFLLGGVFASQFGMSAIYGTRIGLSVSQVSLFVSVIYVSALVAQYPIGWLSDRLDRRILIMAVGVIGGFGALLALFVTDNFAVVLISAAILGGTSNPLYALLIAYTNDYLERDDMAAASGGLLFINGIGAIAGPLIVGWMMDTLGANGYWMFSAVLMFLMGGYAAYRMTRRSRADIDVDDAVSYAAISATSTPIVAEVAQEVYSDAEEESLESEPSL